MNKLIDNVNIFEEEMRIFGTIDKDLVLNIKYDLLIIVFIFYPSI